MYEILVVSGILIVAIIGIGWFVYHRRHIGDSDFQLMKNKRHDPQMDDPAIIEDFDDIYKQELSQTILNDTGESPVPVEQASEVSDEPITEVSTTQSELSFNDEPEVVIIAFTIMSNEEKLFSGTAVEAALIDLTFEYGTSQFFHLLDTETEIALISVANILSPGTLDPKAFTEMETPGLLMFSQFVGAVEEMDLFDLLLKTAEQLTDKLGGVLSDELRQPVNDQKLEELHNKVRKLQLSQ